MARVAARVSDKRVLRLIRAFLKAGVMEDGLVSPVDEGTPQGGPLSPLLSNLVLDDLDKELTRRVTGSAGMPTMRISMFAAAAPENGDGVGEPVSDQQAAAAGQRDEKRGGATGGAQVPGVQCAAETWKRSSP